jgi:transposase
VARIIKVYFSEDGTTIMRNRGGGRSRELTAEQVAAVNSYIDRDCTISLRNIQEKLIEEFNVTLGSGL